MVDVAPLSDPRWQRPYSGLYWQIDGVGRADILRSRSLWDTTLAVPPDTRADGSVHTHEGVGPRGQPLLLLARTIHRAGAPGAVWRVAVAGSTDGVEQAVLRFRGPLATSLLVLFALLSLAAWAQVVVGLAPLNTMRRALDAVRSGRSARLAGRFPAEVQPLVDDFNDVLDRNAVVAERARKHAGNLAHAVRTPLTVLRQSAERLAEHARSGGRPLDATALSRLMLEQVDSARRHVDWHLARSRSAGTERMPGQSARLAPIVQGLVRVMRRVHADRGLRYDVGPFDDRWAVQGEEQDLQEMLGNLMDNACKWARSAVSVRADPAFESARQQLRIRLAIEAREPGATCSSRYAMIAGRTPGPSPANACPTPARRTAVPGTSSSSS